MNGSMLNETLAKPRVLVIDDDQGLCSTLSAGLSLRGYRSTCAFSLREGVAQAMAERPDLIISDIHLEDGQGFDMLCSLARHPDTEGIPVIMMSGFSKPQHLERSLNLGAVDFLSKPFSLEQMVEAADKQMILCKQRRRRSLAGHAQVVAMMEANPDLVTTTDGTYSELLHLNRAARTFLGVDSSDESAVLSTHVIHPPAALERILREGVSVAVRDGSWMGETEFRRADGTEVVFSQVLLAHKDPNGRVEYLSSIARDISAAREVQTRLSESRRLLQVVLDTIPMGVFWKDRSSAFLGCNRQFAEDAGFHSPKEIVGKTDLEMCWADRAERYHTDDRSVWESGQAILHREEEQTRPDGTCATLSTSRVPLRNEDGEIEGILGVYQDATQLRQAEQRFDHASNLLRTLLENSADYIYFKDRQSRLVVCSKAKVQKHIPDGGIDALVGRTDFDTFGVEHAQRAYDDEQEIIRTGKGVVGKVEQETNLDGSISWVLTTKLPWRDNTGGIIGTFGISRDITEIQEAQESLRIYEAAFRSAASPVIITDKNGTIVCVNPAFTWQTGYTPSEAIGQNPRIFKSGAHDAHFYEEMWQCLVAGHVWQGELKNRRKDGSLFTEDATIAPVRGGDGAITHYVAVKQDVTARKEAERQRDMMEIQDRHSQKLESMGRLAAGIAHEINTPTQYIGDNVRFLQDAFADLSRLHAAQASLLEAAKTAGAAPELVRQVEQLAEEADVDYLAVEIPKAIDQSLEGVGRVSKIVGAMKQFSHPGGGEKTSMDLNKTIESTLTVSRNEWKYHAELVTDFDPALPPVPCYPDEFNQVILNLVVNAAHAIADVVKDADDHGTITVRTRHDGDWAEVRIQDTGGGIPKEVQERVFDPFFTTKEVGKGTGQGLAIARSVVVDKHGGTITFETEEGRGTTFIIRFPLAGAAGEGNT